MPDLVERAKERIAEIEKELAELRQFVATAVRLQRTLTVPDAPTVRHRSRQASSQELTVAAAREIILDAGEPVRLQELFNQVRARGIEIGGKNPPYTLSARLSNSGQFISDRKMGWWVADQPPPPGFRADVRGISAEDADSLMGQTSADPENSQQEGGEI